MTQSIFKCEICDKHFTHNWKLQRHYQRKTKCKKVMITINSNIEHKVELLDKNLKETQKELELTKIDISTLNDKIVENKGKYKCVHCSKYFTQSNNLSRHLRSCKSKIDNISIYEKQLNIASNECDNLTCRFCLQKYTKQSSLSKHKTKGCKSKIEYEADLRERVLKNRKEAAQSVQHHTTNVNGDHNMNIVMNIQKIEMNPFGSENLDYITTKLLIKELNKCKAIEHADVCGIVDRFTKLIHANPAHPENQNVLFKSLNSGFAQVYTESGFEDKQATEVQDQVIQNVHSLIQKKGCDEFDNDTNENFADVLDDIDVNYGKLDVEIRGGINTRDLGRCRNTVKAVLHSNKDAILSTQNLIDS